MRTPIERLRAEYLDAGLAYYRATDGATQGSATDVLLAGARMRIAAKVYGRARDELERAMRAEAPTLTSRHRELAAMTGSLPDVDVGEPEGAA